MGRLCASLSPSHGVLSPWWRNQLWCWSLTLSPCPFLLQMELLCEHQQIRVLLDGRQLCDFTHRIQPLNLVKALQISGDIKLTKVAWKKKETTISPGDRGKCTFFLSEKCFIFSPGWFWRVGTIFLICWYVWNTHFFLSYTLSSCRAVAGPDLLSW